MPRQSCSRCRLASSACVCKFISAQAHCLPVIVLQHPDEQHKALGTAKLLSLGLTRCDLQVAIDFSLASFQASCDRFGVTRPLLLYSPPDASSETAEHLVLDCDPQSSVLMPVLNQFDGLVVLDGTWRNTRELWLSNTWLKTLPILTLDNPPSSQYRIRKSQKADGLSTIEAVGLVLSTLDKSFDQFRLLLPFQKLIDYQIARMGVERYRANYGEL